MRMDRREEGREEREVSWEKTPFGKEVSLLLLSQWREWECGDEWSEMKWGWKGIWGWYCCRRCLEEGRWVDWNWGTWVKERKEQGIMRREWEEEMKQDFWDCWMLFDWVIPMSLNEGPLWHGMEMKMKKDWKRDLRRVRWLKTSGGIEVSLLEYK